MRYVSTRGAWHDAPRPFREILLEGLAPDGGLAVPEHYPRLTRADLARMRPLDYRGLAFEVLSRFADDIARILADRGISIDAMIQKEPPEGEQQTDIILLTHLSIEHRVVDAIGAIEALPTVRAKIVRIRLEGLQG